jgi:2-(1,2-epoxy-1,2-dihydrophenyl)acetyl-CoA isomerase
MPDVGVSVRREGGVATITFSRPEARNALTPVEVAANAEDRVVVLTGEGEAFCAGADLIGISDTVERIAAGPVSRGQFTREVMAAARSLHRLPKPSIAAVNGVAAGGGCNLALGCDVAFAAESARFSQIFVNRGLVVDYGGTWLLPRLVGLQRAKDIAFRGDVLSAAEALALEFEAEAQAQCLGSDDFREAVKAFFSKQSGTYTGR